MPCASLYFITSEILQATTDDICLWSDCYLINTHTDTHTFTSTHRHMDTQLLARTHSSLIASFIFSPDPPQPPRLDHEHVSAVTYCCCLLSIHVEAVIRKSDQLLLFTEVRLNGVVTLCWVQIKTAGQQYKHLQCHNVNNLRLLMGVNDLSSSMSNTQPEPYLIFFFFFWHILYI